jgi:hypothetical protein
MQQRLSPGAPQPERPPDVWQRLSFTEDQRKTLDLRVRQLQTVVESKDRALIQATQEVLAANEEVAQTRADMERWKKEMTALRDRLRNSEKDNMATLQSIVALMEQMVDHSKKPEGTMKSPPKGPSKTGDDKAES